MRYHQLNLIVGGDGDYFDTDSIIDAVITALNMELPEVKVLEYAGTELILVDKSLVEEEADSTEVPVKYSAEPSAINDSFIDWTDSQADAIKDALVETEFLTQQKLNKDVG